MVEKIDEITEINKIYKTLMHFPGSTFSDLWDKEIPSNKFNYYLKKMETESLIEKKDGKYFLTLQGKENAVEISGDTGKKEERPVVALLLVIRRDKKNTNRKNNENEKNYEYILYRRMKEPYYNHCGFPGAKMQKGEEILESAKRELKEETNFDCDGKIIGVQNCKVKNDGKLFHHFLQFVILFENPKGELIKESREGTYEWASKKEILGQKKLFPDIKGVLESIEKNEFYMKELDFLQENQQFTGILEKGICF